MIFALLFIIAFLVGLAGYLLTSKWLSAALISMGLFVLNAISDTSGNRQIAITLILGLPVVFVASLLGAYVVELRRGIDDDESDIDLAGAASDDVHGESIESKVDSTEDKRP